MVFFSLMHFVEDSVENQIVVYCTNIIDYNPLKEKTLYHYHNHTESINAALLHNAI